MKEVGVGGRGKGSVKRGWDITIWLEEDQSILHTCVKRHNEIYFMQLVNEKIYQD